MTATNKGKLMNGPLEDVVVLDLTQQLAGPGGTMLLGAWGP